MAFQPIKRVSRGPYTDSSSALSGEEYDENLDRIVAEFETKASASDPPISHASSHAAGQPDEITPADIGAATAAQGSLADSATQPGDLAAVATTGAYADLSGPPPLGTAAAADTGDFATTAQGTNSREWTADTIAEAEAEAGSATTRRAFTAERVRQAIVAWWATFSSTIATLTGAETLTNKTLGDIKEGTATITDGAAIVLDPRNTTAGGYGSMAAWNIADNDRTATLANFTAGMSMTVSVTATTGSLTVTGADWGDAGAPTLVNGENDLLFYSTDGTTVKAVAGWKKAA